MADPLLLPRTLQPGLIPSYQHTYHPSPPNPTTNIPHSQSRNAPCPPDVHLTPSPQGEFTEYYANYGFFGTLTSLSDDTMYKLECGGGALTVWGAEAALPKTINFQSGWNFLPCPHQASGREG